MKKKIVAGTLLLLVLVSAVGYFVGRGKEIINHNYVFVGAGEYWTAEYKVTAKEVFHEKNNRTEYSSNSTSEIKLIYSRELTELSELKEISYSFKGNAGSESGTEALTVPPKSKEVISRSSSGNGAFERKESKIEVTVEWQDKKETFYLTAK